MEQFHVSQVAALLGLTLFVLGYALGPMILVQFHLCILQSPRQLKPIGSLV